jgi:hypothetical protein
LAGFQVTIIGRFWVTAEAKTNASALNANERNRVRNILESNWQAEMRGCHTYEIWAERETEPRRRIAFRTLAKAEKYGDVNGFPPFAKGAKSGGPQES